MWKNKKTAFTITLLVIIAGLLGVVVAILPERESGVPVDTQVSAGEESASEGIDYVSNVVSETKETVAKPPETEQKVKPSDTEQKVKPAETEQKAKPIERKIFLVIDDVGNSLSLLESLLKIDIPVTFAIMPGRQFSEESARRIKEAGFDMILHQPMEAEGGQNPGVGAIMTGMNADEIYKLLDGNLSGFPEIKGINNHMGSKVTADKEIMNSIMSYLGEKGMFFLDSVTTHNSVAEESAAENGVPFAKRNTLFLDNEDDKVSIKKAFMSGVQVSAATGRAIMIGHIKTLFLVDVIEETYDELKKGGYTFHGISSLFDEGGAG